MIIIASHMGKYMILIYICVRVHANASFAHIYSVASIHLLYLYSTVCLRKSLMTHASLTTTKWWRQQVTLVWFYCFHQIRCVCCKPAWRHWRHIKFKMARHMVI